MGILFYITLTLISLALTKSASGAIHLHVRRVVGLEDKEKGLCGQLYRNLTAKVDNLDPYFQFVVCARQHVTAGRMTAADGSGLTFRLLGKGKAWVVDGAYDPYKPNEFGPIFHHGVKPPFEADKIQMYNLNISVSCGMHSAPDCSMCVIKPETGEWVGEHWCHGDCNWLDGVCVLSTSGR